jgi:hypothetical protein
LSPRGSGEVEFNFTDNNNTDNLIFEQQKMINELIRKLDKVDRI